MGFAILWIVTLVSFAPLISVLAAGIVADWLGCPLDEGSVHPCRAAGVDIGETLYAAAVLGWLMLATWPGMLASLVLWGWLLGRRLLRARRPASKGGR
jgi:hypothetical protein